MAAGVLVSTAGEGFWGLGVGAVVCAVPGVDDSLGGDVKAVGGFGALVFVGVMPGLGMSPCAVSAFMVVSPASVGLVVLVLMLGPGLRPDSGDGLGAADMMIGWIGERSGRKF